MKPTTRRARDELVRFATQQLRNLGAEVPGLLGSLVATGDGFEVAAFSDGSYTVSKLAAMSSAMHGLGSAVVKEAGLQGCRDVIVDSLGGKIVFMSIPGTSEELLLMAISDQRAPFGQLLLGCRKCCVAIGEEWRRGGW
jgi:predicted regulator of Ras-like GTPase activity (Roadblock/LC7/MglB family)